MAEQVCASFQSSLRNLFPGRDILSVKGVLAAYAQSRGGKEKNRDLGLQPQYIDSYLLHSPLLTLEHTIQAWRVMELLVDAGFVREIGFSSAYFFFAHRCVLSRNFLCIVQYGAHQADYPAESVAQLYWTRCIAAITAEPEFVAKYLPHSC